MFDILDRGVELFRPLLMESGAEEVVLDRYLLADTYHRLPDGESFDRALALLRGDHLYRGDGEPNWIFDDGKISIVYAHIQKLAREHRGEKVVYHVFDDRFDRTLPPAKSFLPLMNFFKRYPGLCPKNVTMSFYHYGQAGIPSDPSRVWFDKFGPSFAGKVQGAGAYYPFWESSIRRLGIEMQRRARCLSEEKGRAVLTSARVLSEGDIIALLNPSIRFKQSSMGNFRLFDPSASKWQMRESFSSLVSKLPISEEERVLFTYRAQEGMADGSSRETFREDLMGMVTAAYRSR